ncbi:cytochrome P450 86B1-like [Tasmannia lanceolata]|uniref:cytochrome P450 86B1-like n=1 Tax=Tasmannia lanceolata TaxID=3420 RepID=UPI00406424AE
MNSGNHTALFSGQVTAVHFISNQFLSAIQALELFLVLVFALFVSIHSLWQKKTYGVPIWPFLGMLPSLIIAIRSNIYEWLTTVLDRQNGTFIFKGPWLTNINATVTADPRNIEHLLKTKFPNFPKGGYFKNATGDLLGDGIFNADDDTWRQQRKTASLEFHSAGFRQMTFESLIELVHSRLLPVLEDFFERRVPIDLQDVLLRLTFDNVCMIAFGVDPSCLGQGLPVIPFARSFEDAMEVSIMRFVKPINIWKLMRFLNVGSERKLKRSIATVHKFVDDVICKRKEELTLDSKKPRSDLLTVFMRLKDDNGKPFSDKYLRDICVSFILAGRDTSALAMAWFFWLLDQNPTVEERIMLEICSLLGERDSLKKEGNIPVIFQPEEVKRMDYLQAALSEALRLYPSVPVDLKEVVEEDVFPDGTVLKKGMKVIYAIYAMGRMESIWGKDCKEFKPDRWLRDGRYMSESAYKFTAFNGGPRLCLGKDFAYYQMKFVAASIIYHYRIRVLKNFPVEPKVSLTMYMKYGLKVMLYKRDESETRDSQWITP